MTVIQTKSSNEPTYDDIDTYLQTDGFKTFQKRQFTKIGGPRRWKWFGNGYSKSDCRVSDKCWFTLRLSRFDQLQNPGVDCYLVPTTAGTGSESSYNASLIDTSSNKKMGKWWYMYAG